MFMKKDIRNLIAVIGVAVLAAVATTTGMLYYYGPTGQYGAANTLIEPSILGRLNYNDINPKTNQSDRYAFDQILYTFWDKNKKEWGYLEIDIPTYQKFYNLISKDTSTTIVPDEVSGAFSSQPQAKLEIKVKTESSTQWQKDVKDLVRVEFVENSDYYRIELNEENKGVHWAYFYHPTIYQEAFRLFIP